MKQGGKTLKNSPDRSGLVGDMNSLVKYDEACRAIAAAASVDEAKDIADKAAALAAYARQARNVEMEIDAAEIRVRAKRRIGELSLEVETIAPEESGAMAHGLPSAGKTSKAAVLAAAGISTSEAHRCEQIAEIPEADIEACFAACREKGRAVTSDALATHATRQANEEKRRSDLHRAVTTELPRGIFHGDFYELSRDIPDNSVDLIFTDPPYDADSVPLYEKAAEVAARILKPGGSFIAYSGQKHLPGVFHGCGKHLVYWWTCAAIHGGGDQLLQKLGIRCGWKPLVWYVKQTRGNVQNIMADIVLGDREKDNHEWQQSSIEARYFIQSLSAPGGYVVDFFLGSGTTAKAAVDLGRRFIGYELNAGTIERASVGLA